MHDINFIRNYPGEFDKSLQLRFLDPVSNKIINLDKSKREILTSSQELRFKRKTISSQFAKSDDAEKSKLQEEVRLIKEKIDNLENELLKIDNEIHVILSSLPNLPEQDVPHGKDENDNPVIRSWGTKVEHDFEPQAHWDLGEKLGLFDFERGAKVAGSGQIVTVMYIQRLTNLPTTDTIGNGRPYQLEYNDILGSPIVLHGNLPTKKVDPAMLDLGLFFNIICQKDSLKFVMTNENWVLSNLDQSIPIRTDAQDITDPYSYEPMLYKHSFVIESGNYTPVEMASILSDKCQTVQPNDKFTNVNELKSPFLQSDSSLQKLYLPTTTDQIEVLSTITNSIYAFQYTKPDGSELTLPLWQGASQVSFSFDKFNKFSLDYAHTPWYSTTSDSADIACSIQNYFFGITPSPGIGFTLTQHSGIAFTGLTPKSFWEGKLGFNVGEMTIFPQAGVNEAGGDGYYYPLIDFENGKNVVTGQLIQDMLIKKSTLFYQTSNLIGQEFLSDLTTPIVAPNPPFANEVNKNGYYLIEIGNKILNKFIGPNQNFNNIQSIVSTYFSLNSYTLGTSSDSIIYTHSGAPVPISSFDIRILDSNKNLAANLGNDNSIYLELIKAPKAPKQQI